MEWNNNEQETTKKGMNLSSKILLGIIACIVIIIILIVMLLLNTKEKTTFSISVDGKAVTTTKEALLTTINNVTYVNIAEFSTLVGYEYHEGEYKAYVTEKDKCYVEGANETASFYLNDNKVYKLPLNEREKEYEVYTIDNEIKSVNGKLYAPLDAISKAFNLVLDEQSDKLKIYTLESLITTYDAKIVEWGYASIANQSFENDKALLYGYLIVRKEGGLYKIIDSNNTKEIVLDRYSSIEFSEYMQEFKVTDNVSKKTGIINTDGTTKIEPNYESISVLDKQYDLYLVKQSGKYGVVKGGNITVIFPEFDAIGLNSTNIVSNKCLILDTLIPVYKGQKWGAYDKDGKLVLALEYDGFGYDSTNIEVNGVKESVEPVLEIKRANGVVVKKEGKYGLIDVNGKVLVKTVVDSIYAISDEENEDSRYFMLYNGNKLNIIKELVNAGLIEDTSVETDENENGNTITN